MVGYQNKTRGELYSEGHFVYPFFAEIHFCTDFACPKNAKKRDTHGFQKKKRRKFRNMSFLFGSFFYKREKFFALKARFLHGPFFTIFDIF